MLKIAFLYGFLFLALFLRFLSLPSQKSYPVSQEITIVTILAGEPQFSGKSQKFRIENGIEVIAARYPEYHYGDELKISGKVEMGARELNNQGNGLLNFKQSDLKLFFPKIELLEKKKGNWFLGNVFFLRQKLIANYQEFLPEPSSALLVGIVLGSKTQINPSFKEDLRKAGLTHVVVASGMNITFVASFLSGAFTFFLRRQIAFPLIILGIFFYAILAGFEPPVIRAAIMGSLALLAQTLGKQNWAAFSLFLACFLMLLVKPLLILDLGFQLSFLATAGLIFIKPVLDKIKGITLLSKIPLLGESFTTTLSAQLATLPPILANFGYYSMLSVLANALVLWTIPWIMGLGAVAGIGGLVFAPLGQMLSLVVYSFLFYFETVASFFGRFEFFSLGPGGFSFFFSLAYFCFLSAFLLWVSKARGGWANGRMGK